ncbi:hypothetical protein C450_19556 [Halococcus salifodinae DSM 8989]|uniref:Uncharacterized protein n=1 Tax=Halococcus salifodinae DSM 8989 TaxID=1227456 RepID=M0MUR9_9EURY|nr:hypothetical protein C450_19556 [Halococcus salifodinae DSM 8989]
MNKNRGTDDDSVTAVDARSVPVTVVFDDIDNDALIPVSRSELFASVVEYRIWLNLKSGSLIRIDIESVLRIGLIIIVILVSDEFKENILKSMNCPLERLRMKPLGGVDHLSSSAFDCVDT